MRILLLQLAVSVSIYRVATCYDQHIPASLGHGDKGHSFTIPSSQLTFKDEIGTVKVPRSWLQALLSLGNWSVIGPLEHTGLQKKPQPAIAPFPQQLPYDWYVHLRMEHICAMQTKHPYYLISFIYSFEQIVID